MNALIIDDIPENIELLMIQIEPYGIEGIAALTGRQGFELATQLVPDMIFIDILMPEYSWDGYETIRQLKLHPRTQDIPLIAVTGAGNELELYEMGCDYFLKRPYKNEGIRSILDKLICFD